MALVMLPGGWVDVRPLTGHDERALFGADARAGDGNPASDLTVLLTLIDQLLVERPGALIGPGEAARLTTAARDHLLAAIYRQVYGDRVVSTARCGACNQPFDLSFHLPDLLTELQPAPVSDDGFYATADGLRFRLPTGLDELAVIGLTTGAARRALLARCTGLDESDIATWNEARITAIEGVMEQVAPLIHVDLSATCPECGATHKIRFDIAAYLLGRLRNDSARLAREVHVLALTYHWGLHDILSLSRAERGRYLALIDADASRARLRSTQTGTRRRIG